jgi:hypothetical protein
MDCRYSNCPALRARSGPFEGPARVKPPALPGDTYFRENLQVLMELARKQRLALMCAEAVPWRCHRSLIANALVAWGFDVERIMSATHC